MEREREELLKKLIEIEEIYEQITGIISKLSADLAQLAVVLKKRLDD